MGLDWFRRRKCSSALDRFLELLSPLDVWCALACLERPGILNPALVDLEPEEIESALMSMHADDRTDFHVGVISDATHRNDEVDSYYSERSKAYADASTAIQKASRRLDRLIASGGRAGRRDSKTATLRRKLDAMTTEFMRRSKRRLGGGLPGEYWGYAPFIETLDSWRQMAGWSLKKHGDSALADLILASNDDWRRPPCRAFVDRYLLEGSQEGVGGGRERLLVRLREMRHVVRKVQREIER
jgi:hypothetical protein